MSEKSDLIPKISRPANDALTAAGILSLRQVASKTRKEIANLHGMGAKGMRILEAALTEQGLKFADEK